MLPVPERNELARRLADLLVETTRFLHRDQDEPDEYAIAEALAKTAIVGIESTGYRIVQGSKPPLR